MTNTTTTVDLGSLGFDEGAHIPLTAAITAQPGEPVWVRGTHPDLIGGLATWCRQRGHSLRVEEVDDRRDVIVVPGPTAGAAWLGAIRAGGPDASTGVVDHPRPDWGLAPRGSAIEPGGPEPTFRLDRRDEVWTDRAPGLYRSAAASQWDPSKDITWDVPIDNPTVVERAVVQLMTFLIENEEAALIVPSRFLGQVHPHFREIQQILAITAADEARHIEVFSRRAQVGDEPLGLSAVGGRASLQTLIDEPDFAIASFLLSVMGEGTFVTLLGFLERHAPDEVTRVIARLVRQDESRHVAFAMNHLARHTGLDPGLCGRMAAATERRHHELRSTSGLNDEVFDALVVIAAGSTEPSAIRQGWALVQALLDQMADGRRQRLQRLGFATAEAEEIAAMHTRNFM